MNFLLGILLFIAGSALVALCLVAIPGAGGAAEDHAPGHGGHGGH